MKEERERKKTNKKIYFSLSFLVMFVALFGMTFVDPELMIGWIWDWDIDNQLEETNRLAVERSLDEISLRLTYDNNDSTDMRIERALNVFYEKFGFDDNHHTIEKLNTENFTTVQFTWQTYYEKSLLEKRKIQLEEFYDGN